VNNCELSDWEQIDITTLGDRYECPYDGFVDFFNIIGSTQPLVNGHNYFPCNNATTHSDIFIIPVKKGDVITQFDARPYYTIGMAACFYKKRDYSNR